MLIKSTPYTMTFEVDWFCCNAQKLKSIALFTFNKVLKVFERCNIRFKLLKDVNQIPCYISCVFNTTVLLKPYVVGGQIIQFRPKEVDNYRLIMLAVDSNELANVVSKVMMLTAPINRN